MQEMESLTPHLHTSRIHYKVYCSGLTQSFPKKVPWHEDHQCGEGVRTKGREGDEVKIKPYFQSSKAIIELLENVPVPKMKSLSHYCQF